MSALWIVAVAAAAALSAGAAEWLVLRAVQRRRLDELRARHLQQQLSTTQKLEQAKRQIGLLKQELESVRLEARQRRERAASWRTADAVHTRAELERQLDAAPPRPRLPANGFADTLPAQLHGQGRAGGLLMR